MLDTWVSIAEAYQYLSSHSLCALSQVASCLLISTPGLSHPKCLLDIVSDTTNSLSLELNSLFFPKLSLPPPSPSLPYLFLLFPFPSPSPSSSSSCSFPVFYSETRASIHLVVYRAPGGLHDSHFLYATGNQIHRFYQLNTFESLYLSLSSFFHFRSGPKDRNILYIFPATVLVTLIINSSCS